MMASDGARLDWARAVALGALALGTVGVALAVLPYRTFDLDRFFVPKELVLHGVALIVAAVFLVQASRLVLTRVDTFLGAYLVLSAASALLAPNGWLAWRALAVSVSAAVVFWGAREVARAGMGDRLLTVLLVGVWLVCMTALLQAYGLRSVYVSVNRAPGGTLGNRNFVAHLAAIAVPAMLLRTLGAPTRRGAMVAGAGFLTLAMALTLSRSRAAWLALAAIAPLAVIAVAATRRHWRGIGLWRRASRLLAATAVGVLVAVFAPNTLNWKSDSPYLDSVRGVVDYHAGSGRGRLVQYRNTLRMSVSHPLLGVGPGNWAVAYPRYASPNDPSIDDDGMTSNPWPSSDWMAIVSERGWPALACLVLVFVGLGVGGLLQMTGDDGPAAARGVVLVATAIASVVVGAFDALLLLAAPALIVWGIVGALAPPARARTVIPLRSLGRLASVAAAVLFFGVAAYRSASEGQAMELAERIRDRGAALVEAAARDPGSYPIQMRVARVDARRQRCEGVRLHARRAHALFPAAPEPRRLLASCGSR